MDLIVKMKFGSHLYGTDTEASDVDYKGVFLPARRDILLGRVSKCRRFSTGNDLQKNTSGDVDEEIYSLHHFIKLACDGQTVAMDMLHAPEQMLLESSAVWRRLQAQRHRFYTKNLSAFVRYARRQASKYGIKGSRLNAASQVMALLAAENPGKRLRSVWHQLPRDDYCCVIGMDPNGMRQYQVCGKTFQESAAIGYVLAVLQKFYADYAHRAKMAAENRNLDWKAISHALRAALQTKEILFTGTLCFPLQEAPFLEAVKAGRLDYGREVAPVLEDLMDTVEKLITKSDLPPEVDTQYWDDFICRTLKETRFKR
jgi:hypothetical protein